MSDRKKPFWIGALACDYDGTLATDGKVTTATLSALERIVASGRKLLMVTGRELDDLRRTFDRLDLFHRIVAENGALLVNPATGDVRRLGDRPSDEFIAYLRQRDVPISVGESIVATWAPHESTVLEGIKELGLELQVIFNKGAVMVLPSGVNKSTGMLAALDELGLSRHDVVGVGDAENDHAFLDTCHCSVAVSNALPQLKERADFVTTADHGAGVEELIEHLLTGDVETLVPHLKRHIIRCDFGSDTFSYSPHAGPAIVVEAGVGSDTGATATLIKELITRRYQIVIADLRCDGTKFPSVITLPAAEQAPDVAELLEALKKPEVSIAVSFEKIPEGDRLAAFAELDRSLFEIRAERLRPHLVVARVDPAYLPSLGGIYAKESLAMTFFGRELSLASQTLTQPDLLVAQGPLDARTLRSLNALAGREGGAIAELGSGELSVATLENTPSKAA